MSGNRVLLVTGGSRGIGASVCRLAGQAGWQVVVNYASNREAAEGVVEDIRAAGGTAISVEGDVGTELGLASIFAAVDATFGQLDGLVNNAGIIGMPARVDEVSPERLERMFAVNVIGSFIMGLAIEWFALKADPGQMWRLFLTTGILGGFTTFSAFSLDAALLIERGAYLMASVYILTSLIASVGGLFLGLLLIRQLV